MLKHLDDYNGENSSDESKEGDTKKFFFQQIISKTFLPCS